MSIIDTLITDRTHKDHYEITDLNRVGKAMYYVAERLRDCGYNTLTVDPRTDWAWTDRVTPSEARRYLDNLRKLREPLVTLADTPPVPDGARPFNASEANDIEKILKGIEAVVQLAIASRFYSGEISAGEA